MEYIENKINYRSRFYSIIYLFFFFFYKRYKLSEIPFSEIVTFESIHPTLNANLRYLELCYVLFQSRNLSPFDIPFPLYTHRESSMVSSNHFLPLYSTPSITNQFRGYSRGIGSLPVPIYRFHPRCVTRRFHSVRSRARKRDFSLRSGENITRRL